jgi:hypothetical protein
LAGVLFALFIKNTGRYVHQKRSVWIVYFIILLSSLLVLQVLPKENLLNKNTVSEKKLEQAQDASMNLYDAALDGKLEETDGVYKSEQWQFDFSGNSLRIAGDDYLNTMIIAETKDIHDGEIEVFYYVTATILERIDVTGEITTPEVTLDGNRLLINQPEQYTVEFAQFKKEFVMTQFLRESVEQDGQIFRETVFGSQLLYLRVPKGVQIEDTKHGIQFVTKE